MAEREEREMTTDCAEIAELLPVYLNGSLDEASTRRIDAHLASCAACRREERETRTAASLHEGHLPVELLVDYGMATPMSPRRRAVVESHLAVCERCSREVAAVLEEHSDAGDAVPKAAALDLQTPANRDLMRPRNLAWAAGLAALVAVGGWLWTWQQLVSERAAAPRANLPVVELLPATQTVLLRSEADPQVEGNPVELEVSDTEIVLVLLTSERSCDRGCGLEIYPDGESQPTRRLPGLLPSTAGHLTLALPRGWLPPGRSVIALRDAESTLVAEYVVELSIAGS